jgi:glycosyltransferase involved in cell wall biosynthesis
MPNIKLSVVLPSYKDPLLIKTVRSLLDTSELGDQLEIIPVFDGYWPTFELIQDPRVRYVHLGTNSGMREAINSGVRVARGEFLMRSDEHCMYPQGFDKAMTDVCEPNWIMTAKRYFLDPVKWEVMPDINPVEHEKLKIRDNKFEGQRWFERDRQQKDVMVSETMAMQGSMWVMPKKWWEDVIGELQTEGYGPHYQDSHEMIFKTWKAGGKMMLNKNTWYAHKHYSFPRSHKYGSQDQDPHIRYCLETWGDYYRDEIAPKWGIQL